MKVAGERRVVHLYDVSEENKPSLDQKGYGYLEEDIVEIDKGGVPLEAVNQFVEDSLKLPDESELLLYFPKTGDIVYMQDGTGDQLCQDDLDAGYNDYIDYKINSYVDGGDLLFEEGDGGLYLYNHDHVTDWREKIHDCIVEIYGECIPYVVLQLPPHYSSYL